jgi:chorismate dehydratase
LKKIKVGIVNYLNTAPLIFGLQNSPVNNDIQLIPDYPSNLAKDLISGSIDVGLVPVAVIPQLKNWWLVGDYCIGAEGAVASVCLFSEVPVEKIKTVLLDYQSRTSVELVKILFKEYWKMDVQYVNTESDFGQRIIGNTAGVVIGDRSLYQRKISPYVYDLGEAWKSFTGLPFVFAAWVSNKKLDDDFIKAFNDANAYGVRHINEVIATVRTDLFNLEDYFSMYISYHLDEEKRKGLEKFLSYLKATNTNV